MNPLTIPSISTSDHGCDGSWVFNGFVCVGLDSFFLHSLGIPSLFLNIHKTVAQHPGTRRCCTATFGDPSLANELGWRSRSFRRSFGNCMSSPCRLRISCFWMRLCGSSSTLGISPIVGERGFQDKKENFHVVLE